MQIRRRIGKSVDISSEILFASGLHTIFFNVHPSHARESALSLID